MLQDSKELREQTLLLQMLSHIENEPQVSQRALSSHLGVAIGLVNTYLKRCIHKGLIKVKGVPAKRYAYYLTPRGFIEKARITTEYLSSTFKFFREARSEFLNFFKVCEQKGWQSVVLVGKGDLADIANQVSKETSVNVVLKTFEDFLEPSVSQEQCNQDAFIVTDMHAPQATYEYLIKEIPLDRIFTPRLLHISKAYRGMTVFEEAV